MIGESDDSTAVGETDTLVVKIGGAEAVDPEGVVGDIAHLVANGARVAVVHGGSTVVDETLDAMGIEPEYVETPSGVSGRFTDEETMEAFTMAMAGSVNTDLVTKLQNAGVDAVGLSGVDGGLLSGPRKSAVRIVENGRKKIKRGDHSGKIESVETDLPDSLSAGGYVPVVTVPMLGEDDGELLPVNADADRAAAAVAGALDAPLVLLTDVAGVYADPDDTGTLLSSVETPAEFDTLEAAAEGFMSKKVLAVGEALESGSPAAVVADATLRDPILAALDGGGTHVARSAVVQSAETEKTSETVETAGGSTESADPTEQSSGVEP